MKKTCLIFCSSLGFCLNAIFPSLITRYSSVKALNDAFNKGEVDIVFNYYGFDTGSSNETINVYNSSYVILTHINNNITVDSWASLAGKEIYALKDTTLTTYVNNNSKATIKTYSKLKNLCIILSQ